MNENNDKRLHKSVINWYPGHMVKAKREMKEKMNLIDVVYEVVDARMPISSKVKDIDDIIKDKPRIMIMTKYDLCDKAITKQHIATYEKQGYQVLPIDLMQGNAKEVLLLSHDILENVNKKRAQKGLKSRNLRAMVVGVPNVGKSTLINRLVGKNKAAVGNRPGVTKGLGWMKINKELELLDTPGILWPKFENQEQASIMALLLSIKEEVVNQEEIAIFGLLLLSKHYPEKVQKRYGTILQSKEDIVEVLDIIALHRKAVKKGNIPDYEKVYQMILQDIRKGVFGPITLDR